MMTLIAQPKARKLSRNSRGGSIAPARGVALILVLTTLAILTSIGVDFSYSTRVNLKLAENLRDETRAYYLARSAINLSRLILHFQKQLDTVGGQATAGLQNALKALQPQTGANTGVLPGTPGATGSSGSLGIRLWELIPVNSNAFGMFLGGGLPDGIDKAALGADSDRPRDRDQDRKNERPQGAPPLSAPLSSFGAFDGSYDAKITDENSRINVAALGGLGSQTSAPYLQLTAMMADPKYDFLFNEPDANRDRVRREDVIIALKDWMDEDETGSGIDPTNRIAPFVAGFSDENGNYSRYTPRYKAKNARPDSLDELYMVYGVNDRFMTAFGDRLTVWPDINSKLNVNTNDQLQMMTNILIAAQNPTDPALRNPALLRTILQEIQLRKMFSFFGLTAQDFVSILKANGVLLRRDLDTPAGIANVFGDSVDTFRIVATGHVGSVDKKVMAIIRTDDLLGKLLYWKEL
ncbi:MAG: general secretion pathway protein GspK [Deltaproteobacteria bacterium]|nr:general secretion pathway protein GspK [Deltaproteobacteria bacterium]